MDNNRIVERVMRMGIEHRGGMPLDRLYDEAIKQLKSENSRSLPRPSKYKNIQEWWSDQHALHYAFIESANHLTIERLQNMDGLVFVEWASFTTPRFKRVNSSKGE